MSDVPPRDSKTVWLAGYLAAIPLMAGVLGISLGDPLPLWFDTGAVMLPIFMIGLVMLALSRGLRSGFVRGGLERGQILALGGLGLSIILGLVLSAPEPIHAATRLAMQLSFVLAAIAICYLVNAEGERLKSALGWSIFATCIAHLPIVAILYFGFFDSGYNWRGGPVGFTHVRIWGMVLTAGLGAGIGLYLTDVSHRALIWAGMALLWALLFWSGTRGGVAAVIVAYLFSLALFWGRMRSGALMVAVTLVLGAAASLLPRLPEPAYGVLRAVSESVSAITLNDFSSRRVDMWQGAVDLIGQSPLFGAGYDQYQFLVGGYFKGWQQPHNSILEAFLSFGLIGGACLIYVLFTLWLRALISIRKTGDLTRIGAFTGLNALLVFSLVDGVLYHEESLIYVAIFFGIILVRPAPVARA